MDGRMVDVSELLLVCQKVALLVETMAAEKARVKAVQKAVGSDQTKAAMSVE